MNAWGSAALRDFFGHRPNIATPYERANLNEEVGIELL